MLELYYSVLAYFCAHIYFTTTILNPWIVCTFYVFNTLYSYSVLLIAVF